MTSFLFIMNEWVDKTLRFSICKQETGHRHRKLESMIRGHSFVCFTTRIPAHQYVIRNLRIFQQYGDYANRMWYLVTKCDWYILRRFDIIISERADSPLKFRALSFVGLCNLYLFTSTDTRELYAYVEVCHTYIVLRTSYYRTIIPGTVQCILNFY